MPVSSVTASFAKYAQHVTTGAPATGSAQGAAQEANETQAQTTKEAQGGDRIAKAKLAKLQDAKPQQPPAAVEPGKGTLVDKSA